MNYLFSSGQLRDFLKDRWDRIKQEIESSEKDRILAGDREEFVDELVTRYSMTSLELRSEDRFVHEKKETQVDVRHERSRDILNRNRPTYVDGESITIGIPFTGTPTLWSYEPSAFSSHMFLGNTVNHELHLIYEYTEPDSEALKKKIDHELNEINRVLGWIKNDIDIFNDGLLDFTNQVHARRLGRLRKSQEFTDSLGIPARQPTERASSAKKVEKRTIDSVSTSAPAKEYAYDVFISHASEDKESFVKDLADRLSSPPYSLAVWYDDFSLTLGDSLRRSIDKGLASSRFGVVILSKHFCAKEWPQKELDGLVAREDGREKIILPVWHEITKGEVLEFSPTIVDRYAANTSEGIQSVVDQIVEAVNKT